MTPVTAALQIYAESAREALKGLPRSAWAIIWLVLAHIIIDVFERYVLIPVASHNAGNGFLLGFVHFIIECTLIGIYLRLVEIGVAGRRRVSFSDISESIGSYYSPVASVLFILFIVSWVLLPTPGPLRMAFMVVSTLVFNPMPEQVYQDNAYGMDLLQSGAKFMQNNWPEWLAAHAIAAFILVFFGISYGRGGMSFALGEWMLEIFGPYCGFIGAARFSFFEASRGTGGIIAGAALLLFVHTFMLFRGHLYSRLSKSSRRSRVWQARMRGDN